MSSQSQSVILSTDNASQSDLNTIRLAGSISPFLSAGAVHLVFGLIAYYIPVLATVHALAILAFGIYVIIRDEEPERLIYVAIYIAGAEVFWRMIGASVFWEYGKYSIALLLGLGIIKWRMRLSSLPIIYFVLLIPSVFLSLFGGMSFGIFREMLSFNLSGPALIMIAGIFFSNIKLNRKHLENGLLFGALPILCIVTVNLVTILTATELRFGNESNFQTSGGFGPNQVSTTLSLGALMTWLVYLLSPPLRRYRYVLVWVTVGLLVFAAFTFSRGGVLNFIVCAPLATLFLLRANRNPGNNFWLALLAGVFLLYLVMPRLDAFTGGALGERFQNLDTTGRIALWEADIRIWLDHIVYGVGPGQAYLLRSLYGAFDAASHTEYSRLLAEHGIFGILAAALLILMPIREFLRSRGLVEKGIVLALMLWALTEMSHGAMRIAAISFLYALPMARYEES